MNTIKLDLTYKLFYRNAYSLSWERLIKKNQTLGITIGYQEFPKVFLGENIESRENIVSGGYKFGAEYRFYLQKGNKFDAPRGVYIGPYFTVLGVNSSRDFIFSKGEIQEEASYKANFQLISVGAQLGYQFVFNDRWTLDLVMIGTSLTNYNAKMRLEGDFSFDPKEVQDEILQATIDKFPGLNDLLEGKELDSSGKVDTFRLGYRYQVLIGYRFGKKFKKN